MDKSIRDYKFRCIDKHNFKEARRKLSEDTKFAKLTIYFNESALNRIHTNMWTTIACGHDYGMANHELTVAILQAIVDQQKEVVITAKEIITAKEKEEV